MTILDNQNNNQIDQNFVVDKFEVPQPTTNKTSRKLVIVVLLIAVLILCGGVFGIYKYYGSITDFDSCKKAGFSVRLLNCLGCPKFCDTPWGVSFSSGQFSIQPTITPTPTINPTSDWKTYTNKKYKLEFKYPDSLDFIESDTNNEQVSNYLFLSLSPKSSDPTANPLITFGVTDKYKSLESYLNNTFCSKDMPKCPPDEITVTTTIDNRTGLFIKDDWYFNIHRYVFYINNLIYDFKLDVNSTLHNQFSTPEKEMLFDQILPTIKFLDTSSSNDTNITSLSCNELEELIRIEENKLNYECKTDSDCVNNGGGKGCGYCVNKNTIENEKYLEKMGEIEGVGINKCNWAQLECKYSECQCISNKCKNNPMLLENWP